MMEAQACVKLPIVQTCETAASVCTASLRGQPQTHVGGYKRVHGGKPPGGRKPTSNTNPTDCKARTCPRTATNARPRAERWRARAGTIQDVSAVRADLRGGPGRREHVPCTDWLVTNLLATSSAMLLCFRQALMHPS